MISKLRQVYSQYQITAKHTVSAILVIEKANQTLGSLCPEG